MICNIDKSLLDGLIDNQLNVKERLEINTHIAQCDDCQAQLKQMQATKSQTSSLRAPTLSADFELKLRQKIAAAQGQEVALSSPVTSTAATETQTTADNIVAMPKRSSAPLWAMVASVAIAVSGLSWFMLQNNNQTDLVALESQRTMIEITSPVFSEQEVRMISLQVPIENEQVHWADGTLREVASFEEFTQSDDGYQSFNCGSVIGDRGCSFGTTKMAASITISSSI
jgi:anti-sigma factor RsiW